MAYETIVAQTVAVVLGIAVAGTAPTMMEQHCTGCHRGTEATGNLAQGIRNLQAVPCDMARRFVAEHYVAMTGRRLQTGEAREIYDMICAREPVVRPEAPKRTRVPGT